MTELQNNVDNAKGLVSMYQAGFLDGYIFRSKGHPTYKATWGKIKDNCMKQFELRFMKKVNKQIRKITK